MTISKKLFSLFLITAIFAGLLAFATPTHAGFFDWLFGKSIKQEAAVLKSTQTVDTKASATASAVSKTSNAVVQVKPDPVPVMTIRPGYKNDAVKSLQESLKAAGYYAGTIDGSYGSGTVAAVRTFQKAQGLKADGIAGANTITELNEIAASPTIASCDPNDTPWVQVTSPNGGESFDEGVGTTITWKACNIDTESVDVTLRDLENNMQRTITGSIVTNGLSNYMTITLPESGTWFISDGGNGNYDTYFVAGDHFKIIVEGASSSGNSYEDSSNAVFAIGNGLALSQCNDGIDNDSDSFIDYPADPACDSLTDGNENPYNIANNTCDTSDIDLSIHPNTPAGFQNIIDGDSMDVLWFTIENQSGCDIEIEDLKARSLSTDGVRYFESAELYDLDTGNLIDNMNSIYNSPAGRAFFITFDDYVLEDGGETTFRLVFTDFNMVPSTGVFAEDYHWKQLVVGVSNYIDAQFQETGENVQIYSGGELFFPGEIIRINPGHY